MLASVYRRKKAPSQRPLPKPHVSPEKTIAPSQLTQLSQTFYLKQRDIVGWVDVRLRIPVALQRWKQGVKAQGRYVSVARGGKVQTWIITRQGYVFGSPLPPPEKEKTS